MHCGQGIRAGRPEHIEFGRPTFVFFHVTDRGMAAIALDLLRRAVTDREVVHVTVAVEAAGLARVLRIERSTSLTQIRSDRIVSVTWAPARIWPRSLNTRTISPSLIPAQTHPAG